MELKLDMIAAAPQSLSPGGDRTIALRDARVSAIANLGATRDGYDCIDLSNNEIQKLDNIPLLPRLKTLIVANNRISKISADLEKSLPNLLSLVLTGNNIKALSDLVPIFSFSKLERLSLIDNPVIAVPHFREYVAFCLPSLRYLNFCKVTQKERASCEAFFKSKEGLALIQQNGYLPPALKQDGLNSKEILDMVDSATDVNSLLQLEKKLME
ncbi:ribonuclease inhibitor like protein [Babesia gibsoni]|uniref:Ribonuclease inhibitor like protein n=1 Tax=Babesia gibsoni TaxID=33632 RepID=A0AAD8LMQ2_BABGI|nr:ribonuclease inhibitor like protein [Babesia gibsoni]